MKRTRKWLLGTGIAIGALVVAIAVIVVWLLYTPAGLRFALNRGVAMTGGQFAYASAHGRLAGEANITGLRYRTSDGTSLHIATATLDLQPWALLAHRLHIRKARIDGIALDIAPSKPKSQGQPFSLQPPLTIVLGDTLLTHIAVSEDGKPTFAADSLAIAGAWSARKLVLRKLALHAPAGSADVDGTLAIARGHRGKGTAVIDWTQDGTRYTGKLTATSDGRTAHLAASLSAPVAMTLAATLALDQHHAWTLSLRAPTFAARAMPILPAAIKTLALDLRGSGDGQGGKLTGAVALNGHSVTLDPAQFRYAGKTLTLDPLRLRAPGSPGVATLTGSVQLAAQPLSAALTAQWSDVQLPADLVGQTLATHGDVRVDGSLVHFALKGALAIGPPGNPSNLQLDLAGTPTAVQVNTLKLVQPNGGLDAHGSVTLQPAVAWNLDVHANRFNPGAFLAGWNGALDFTLATQGRLRPRGPEATLKLGNAGGTLRGRSIAGSSADVAITPRNLLAGSVQLVAGGSRISASGKPGDRTNASVDIDIGTLNDWLPNASGSLRGHFTASGVWPELAVAGTLTADKLDVGGKRIDKLQFAATVPNLAKPAGKLNLALEGVHAAGLDFANVDVTATGTAATQHVELSAHGKPLGLALALQGNLHAKTRRWTGTLSGLELTPESMPAWRQQQPTSISWNAGVATFSQLCLSAGAPRLCISGSRTARGAVTANYTLQQLPLQLLASLASGADPLLASGDVSGSGQLTLPANGALAGHASLSTSAGHIAFASTANQPLLAWTGINLNATANAGNQQLSLRGALADGGHINGTVDVRGAARALSGNLDADLRSLAAISALSPEVANVKGTLTGQLQLGGTLSAPRFQGHIQTHGFSAELPRAGLKLHDGAFAISGDPQGHLVLTGQIASGAGVLHIDGSAGLAAAAPLTLAIKGDNVLVADIPAARVVASPDLNITRSDGKFTLTGSITVPKANVEVEKLPGQGPATASPDVVIVDAPPAAPVKPLALDADIQVKLGAAVKLHGYGLDGNVQGQLAVHVAPGETATGRGQIGVSGKYQAYGQDLTIERGRLLFAGTRLDDPGLDIRAVRQLRSQNVTVGLAIRGTAQKPVLTVFSDPAMEQAEALSYLVTGRPLDALKSGEGNTLNTAAQALGGLAGDRLAKSIGSRIGVEAGVSSNEALGGTAFTAGKYLSPRLFVSYGVGLFTPGQVITLRYTINRFLQFEAENATTGNRASLNYRIEK